jgi:hypothetical protein
VCAAVAASRTGTAARWAGRVADIAVASREGAVLGRARALHAVRSWAQGTWLEEQRPRLVPGPGLGLAQARDGTMHVYIDQLETGGVLIGRVPIAPVGWPAGSRTVPWPGRRQQWRWWCVPDRLAFVMASCDPTCQSTTEIAAAAAGSQRREIRSTGVAAVAVQPFWLRDR